MKTTISCSTPSSSCHLYKSNPMMPVLWIQIDNLNAYIILDINEYCLVKTIVKHNFYYCLIATSDNVYLVPLAVINISIH